MQENTNWPKPLFLKNVINEVSDGDDLVGWYIYIHVYIYVIFISLMLSLCQRSLLFSDACCHHTVLASNLRRDLITANVNYSLPKPSDWSIYFAELRWIAPSESENVLKTKKTLRHQFCGIWFQGRISWELGLPSFTKNLVVLRKIGQNRQNWHVFRLKSGQNHVNEQN